MRIRSLLAFTMLAALSAGPALGSFSGSGSPPPSPSSPAADPARSGLAPTPRQEAERFYGEAYDDITKAKQEATEGRDKGAIKRYRRALERGQRAVDLDSTYHQAWNLVGFAARKTGDYPRALLAYERCLRLAPEFAPAREYLGEAYLELGDARRAREQLTWLERLSQTDQAKSLRARIETWETAHRDTTATPVSPDSVAVDKSPTRGR